MALPATPIIQTGQWVWRTLWQIMMAQLAPKSEIGAYKRPESCCRDRVGTAQFPAAAGRYRLYVGLSCPWAHRTLITRALKGLDGAIETVFVTASVAAGGWAFDPPHEGLRTLAQRYRRARPGYQGRYTVPVLWDTVTQQIVNNESTEIIEFLNREFNDFAAHPDLDLAPPDLQDSIVQWDERIYPMLNNGVYRCGFAQSQAAYDAAVADVFAMLDDLNQHLATHRYLCGERLTLADVRLLPTLIRFDGVYYSLFRCDRAQIRDFPHLWGYLCELYQMPAIQQTCNLEQMRRDYFTMLFPLNPGGIVSAGSDAARLLAPHGRDRVVSSVG